jgi:F-type H+-transporting ATPase subunit epsilon
MSDKEFLLRVVTPDKLYIDNLPVTLVEARGTVGDFGAMPGHEPFLTELKPGAIAFRTTDGERDDFHCEGGIIEVLPHKVTILAETARKIPPEELAEEERRYEQEREKLEQQLAEKKAEKAKASPEDKKKKEEGKAETDKKGKATEFIPGRVGLL